MIKLIECGFGEIASLVVENRTDGQIFLGGGRGRGRGDGGGRRHHTMWTEILVLKGDVS